MGDGVESIAGNDGVEAPAIAAAFGNAGDFLIEYGGGAGGEAQIVGLVWRSRHAQQARVESL